MIGNKHQLRMLMTAKEIRDEYQPWTGDRKFKNKSGLESDEAFWQRKRDEADMNGLTSSVRQRGVVMPIQVGTELSSGKRMITGGHHRVAAAPDEAFIPVVHHSGGIEVAQQEARRIWGAYS